MARGKIRYAVIGLGHIAQVAVLPAFAHASRNSELAALVSGDREKRRVLSERYGVARAVPYEEYDSLLASGDIDAVYIALPNHMHCDYTVRAARAGVHVLCEKPMAVTEDECQRMADAARDAGIKLMVAYRLHFERATLEAIEIARSGRLGELQLFNSTFTMSVVPGNIRVRRDAGGGVLYDIGIYCVNAARSLFREEPVEVLAATAGERDEVEAHVSAVLRFPGERLASFACSFGSTKVSSYRIVGSQGDLQMDPAYDYARPLRQRLTLDGKPRERTFAKRDQFAAELIYFSDCVRKSREPEPSAAEGFADVRVIRALYESARRGAPVRLEPFRKPERPSMRQEISRPPVDKPEVVKAPPPSGT